MRNVFFAAAKLTARHLMPFALALLAAGCATTPSSKIVGEDVTYRDGDTTLRGYLAYDDASRGKRPGILVLHEWWGVTPHVRDYARALASEGYTALAVDMYGEVAEDPKTAGALMKGVMGAPDVMKSRFAAAKRLLAAHPTVDERRLGAIGFSMGGRVALQMARADQDLAGVVSIYGNLETREPARAEVTRSRVLVLHADGDPFVKPESIPAFRSEMEAAKVDYSFVSYPGVKHGFANPDATDRGKRFGMPIAYDAEADRKARAEIFRFFSTVFRKP